MHLLFSETDDNGNAMFQSYVSKLFEKKTAKDTLVPPLWGTREKNVLFYQDYLFTLLYAAELALSR